MSKTVLEIHAQASREVAELSQEIDEVIEKYLERTTMSRNQAIVNVGRALNAHHVNWVGLLRAEVETLNNELLAKEAT